MTTKAQKALIGRKFKSFRKYALTGPKWAVCTIISFSPDTGNLIVKRVGSSKEPNLPTQTELIESINED